ncbi:type II toxin-antitoxin system PemK/MazF family toxin [Natrarchaeobius oligotrophus]|uniref:Type II toxin-antitoxin system PemK/MazF family toxin n=1 Tax=Natrarchaeobius chitinivorans TaxID=1679083 RepID=A0A3N6NAW8_NATCH|nr:type II toxin-antitoxin system PemK/MazF family toxin [Natrarchaeobius chitinivorans]RQG95742.1 type II toxin-antitoxin system PemK/MazF family toxin [Natrarchaeobius chitinivorans]
MDYDRGDVVIGYDKFKENSDGRPFLIVSGENTPFHGEQYITLSLTTRTWYEDRIPIEESDWVEGGAPRSSSIMPWSVNSISATEIDVKQGTLTEPIVTMATEQLSRYVLDEYHQ